MREMWASIGKEYSPEVRYVLAQASGSVASPYAFIESRLMWAGPGHREPEIPFRRAVEARATNTVFSCNPSGTGKSIRMLCGYDFGMFKGDEVAVMRGARRIATCWITVEGAHMSQADVVECVTDPGEGDTVILVPFILGDSGNN